MLDVILSARAQYTLDEISDYYVTRFSGERALKVINSVEETFERIAAAPKNFPVYFGAKASSENMRQAIVHNTFKVIYKISEDKIEIVEIFHGSRNPELLKDIE